MSADLQSWQGIPEPLRQAAVALAYLFFGVLGGLFPLPEANVPLIWPASGLALALVFRLGSRYLLGVGLGAFAVYFLNSQALLPALAATAGAVAGAALGAAILRYGRAAVGLPRLTDVLWLIIAAAVAGSVTSAVGSGVVWLAGISEWQGWRSLWWICWVADSVGALLLAPVLLSLPSTRSPRCWLERSERAVLTAAVLAVSWLVYADALPDGVAMARPLSYLVFPLLIWGAMRQGLREVSLLLLLHAAVAVFYTTQGHGPFAMGSQRESLLALHTHLTMVGVTMLLLAAAMSERRVADSALREQEAQYRLLVENQTDLIMKLDREGRILFASPSLCELLQQPAHELLGRPARRLLESHGVGAALQAWSLVSKPPYSFHLEQPLETAGGQRWIAWVAKGVLEEGKLCAVVAVGRDVTDRHRAEARARQHLQELAHAGRIGALGELAGGLAHELNQPLCAITSYAQGTLRLLPADIDPELRNAIERIAANAQRAGGIISQMRAFVRKDDQLQHPADINQLVEEVITLTRTDARHHAVQLELELARALPTVDVAPIQIQQVLVNLIRNAIEAMQEAGSPVRRVHLRTAAVGEAVEVSVTDSGPGLPSALAEQVFHPFVTTKQGGMGLGLSISRSIIEAHGGTLTVRAGRDGGSEFSFTLPARQLRPAEKAG